ncbi:MAG TPA: peptide deformylase [Gaiellaceae bacterium]
MAIRKVLHLPDPALKRVAAEITPQEWSLVERVADDLLETMHSFPRCVGLAAPQIGESVRMIVVDVSLHPKGDPNAEELLLINPRVISASGSELAREGCLSVPEFTADVRRATECVVEALTRDGTPRTIAASGFEARALQHEIDHLDGLLFLDRVESLSRDVFRRKNYG